MKYSIKDWGKGLNLDVLPSELEPGYCTGSTSNVRFRNGFAERVGGIGGLKAVASGIFWNQLYQSIDPTTSITLGTSVGCYLAYTTATRAYAWDFVTENSEITPFTDGQTISSISAVGTTATLTTSVAHGRTTGDTISVWGCTPTQYNGTYRITVTGATTFTYVTAVAPGGVATIIGLYSYNGSTAGSTISSIVNAGTTATVTTSTAHGRTTGDIITVFGATSSVYNGTYWIRVLTSTTFRYTMASDPGGSASVVGSYVYNGASQTLSVGTFASAQSSGGILNGIFLLNSRYDGLYYWNGDLATRLRKIPGSNMARISRPFGNYVVQLAPTVSGTEYSRRVGWSSATDPGSIPSSFTATSTNDAGNVELAAGGELVDCLPLGDTNIIYATDARYAMRYVGGQSTFSFDRLPGTDGILQRGAVVDTPLGHVFLTTSMDVMLHAGGACKNLSVGRVSTLLKSARLGFPVFVAKNPSKSEVWIGIPTGAASYPKTILMWNWENDTWGRKDLSTYSVACGTSGVPGSQSLPESLYLGSTDSYIGRAESSDTDFNDGTPVVALIERTGLDCGEADVVKNLQRSRWNFDGIAASAFTVYHGSSMTADGSPTYASSSSYTLGTTDYTNARATGGRFLAVKVSWNYADASSSPTLGRLRSCDLDLSSGGKR